MISVSGSSGFGIQFGVFFFLCCSGCCYYWILKPVGLLFAFVNLACKTSWRLLYWKSMGRPIV